MITAIYLFKRTYVSQNRVLELLLLIHTELYLSSRCHLDILTNFNQRYEKIKYAEKKAPQTPKCPWSGCCSL